MNKSWKTVAIVGGCVVVGGAASFFLSPLVGYAVGNLMFGWTGCAATSSGLALLGGGSLASGGAGMAGGTVVITSVGATAGTVVGVGIDKVTSSPIDG